MLKAQRGFRPGFLQLFQTALSGTSRVTSQANFQIAHALLELSNKKLDSSYANSAYKVLLQNCGLTVREGIFSRIEPSAQQSG